MSYDICLMQHGSLARVPCHMEGGTYVVGGTTEACLNVTYNYGWFFYEFLDKKKGIRWLYGKKAKATVGRLRKAVGKLGKRQYEKDYWAPTPGNAGYALSVLLDWAVQHPEAVWEGD